MSEKSDNDARVETAVLAQVTSERDDLSRRVRSLENEIVVAGSLLKWVSSAARYQPVSDFAESFQVVREVVDLARDRGMFAAALERANAACAERLERIAALEGELARTKADLQTWIDADDRLEKNGG